MGYIGKLKEKQQAILLRKRGMSYREIQEQVHVSKSTLSLWCREIILSVPQLEELLNKRLKGSEKGRIIGAKVQQSRRIERTNMVLESAVSELGRLSKRDRFVAGISLYLGDGLKTDKYIGFSNSNAEIIKFMMGWFREFCNVPEEKFRGQIWIHDNLDVVGAKTFWSKLSGIPETQFHKSYIAKNKIGSRKIRKNINKHGVFAIKISDSWLQRRILGWGGGVLGTKLL